LFKPAEASSAAQTYGVDQTIWGDDGWRKIISFLEPGGEKCYQRKKIANKARFQSKVEPSICGTKALSSSVK